MTCDRCGTDTEHPTEFEFELVGKQHLCEYCTGLIRYCDQTREEEVTE